MHPRSGKRFFGAALSLILALPSVAAETDSDPVDEIIVTADFRERTVNELPASISVLGAEFIEQSAVQHFEELINVIPNLNWSGDGHRARYFQIRGVGELEQYQGAPNPSVGFLIDDIDFSGIGTVATMFDVQSVEVLRGSQGSRYGANALGGLIYVRSADPSPERNGRLQLSAGEDDAVSLGLAFGGALDNSETMIFRVSAQKHESNGFRSNSYLGRDDTNGRDESAMRIRLRYQPSATLEANLSVLYSDIDNGYDTFALDNSYTMLSDKPGRDAQQSTGASLRLDWSAMKRMTLTSITAIADSDIEFGFDADWGNDDSWAPVTYDYVSINDRSRRTLSQELRFASNDSGRIFRATTDWLVGLYVQELNDELLTLNQGDYYDPFFDFADSLDDSFGSDYDATSTALFGQLQSAIGAATRLGVGLRIEHRSTDYVDTTSLRAGPSETMWGGELSVSHDHSEVLRSFVSLTKGYKAGGFNLGVVPPGSRDFGEERLWSIETGIKSSLADDALKLNASLFYSRRDDQQVRTSFQLIPGDPASFVFFTDNAAKGRTYGVEAELQWFVSESWELYANLGLLHADFDEFIAPQGDLGGRDQAHAPRYTLAAGAVYRNARGFFVRLDATARDAFYFDVSHDQKSQAYELLNASIGFERDGWLVQLWARNLLDEDYAVRGFYFGNEPPDFPNKLYTRLGDPRQLGVTIEKRFD
ncbi:MAG: TonB-dependent receptor [Gammaproteobacteria bacterium]|nr:TonB-dependent receptor [Gammaproteobacteria bacterium]MBT8110676.1 TonB-dependent receptor [Gammaproteobacteria bacterium]NND48531.1 TonB-dependent receptor [Woeseiaceae bacterium]NNL45375.1 TonB-dependent receptor [Woeseiaceae bacterium]